MEKAEDVELFPLSIGRNNVRVKIPLPIEVHREISETVRRYGKSGFGLWWATLYEIFMVGFSIVKREVGLDNFVTLVYRERRKARKKAGGTANGEWEVG
jgi:hypothetical protein